MLARYLVLLLAICLIQSPGSQCNDIAKSLTQLLDNYKDANYSFSRDIVFGLNLAYKILSGIRPHLESNGDRNEFYWETLEYLKVLKSSRHTRNVSVYGEIILESISESSEVWWRRRRTKYRHLDVAKCNYNFSDYEWIVDQGQPSTMDSDRCMAQLGATKSCVMSSKCLTIMTSRKPSYGYHKTHQCSNFLPIDQSIDFIIGQKCSDIYGEHSILSKEGVPDEYRDLFMEQSLLCGLAGHSEFLAAATIKSIPSWQYSNGGCFNAFPLNMEDGLEVKCMNHINSLGLAFYSNLIAIWYLHK